MYDTISLQRFSSRVWHNESSSDHESERKRSVTAEHSLQAVKALKITLNCKNNSCHHVESCLKHKKRCITSDSNGEGYVIVRKLLDSILSTLPIFTCQWDIQI
jgi:hypothetical protein